MCLFSGAQMIWCYCTGELVAEAAMGGGGSFTIEAAPRSTALSRQWQLERTNREADCAVAHLPNAHPRL
jgi:hypothetical protein